MSRTSGALLGALILGAIFGPSIRRKQA